MPGALPRSAHQHGARHAQAQRPCSTPACSGARRGQAVRTPAGGVETGRGGGRWLTV
jgi:hypothetical protein